MKYKLSDICAYVKGKVDVDSLDEETYISTENMIPNKGGITNAPALPAVPQTQAFLAGDVLISNIRPNLMAGAQMMFLYLEHLKAPARDFCIMCLPLMNFLIIQ